MNAETLLDELASLGIHLVRDGEAILADVEDGADVTPHVDRITNHKPALLRLLLQREFVACASAEPESFDREHLNDLWRQRRALPDPEEEAAALVPQLEAGWDWLVAHADHPSHDAFLDRWLDRLKQYEQTYAHHAKGDHNL